MQETMAPSKRCSTRMEEPRSPTRACCRGICQRRPSQAMVKSLATRRGSAQLKMLASCRGPSGRCASTLLAAATVNLVCHSGRKRCCRYWLASPSVLILALRKAFTRRFCKVPKQRSTRPLAWGECAAIHSIPNSRNARPSWVSVFGPGASVFHPGASVG